MADKELRHYVPQEILDVSFPVGVRGYDRAAVDAYVRRVNRVIAELKVSASPPHAVRHAVEEAEDTVQGLLRAGREAAEQITVSARRDAEETMSRAKAAAADLVVNANDEAERVQAESDEVIASARSEAERLIGVAQADIEERRKKAAVRMRAIEAETAAVSRRRRELLDDIDRLGSVLRDLVAEASGRFEEPNPEEAQGDLADELADTVVRTAATDARPV